MDRAAATRLADASAALAAATPAAGPPPELHAPAPLRQVSPAVQARMVQRALDGRTPLGRDHPRRRLWTRTVAPLAVLAVLDAAGVVVAALHGATGLGVFALVALVVLGGLAVLGARFTLADPLRFTAAERRELAAAQTWASRADWAGPLAASAERGLVAAAAVAVGRIVASPALASPALADHRARLDLLAELDEIDTQAFQVARRGTTQAGAEWDAVRTRVAALICYADELDAAAPAAPAGPVAGAGPVAAGAPVLPADAVARLDEYLDAIVSPAPRDTLPGSGNR